MQVAQDVNHFLKDLEQRLTDQFLQQWKADLLGSRKLRSYRTFKSTFEQEPYLHLPRHLRIPLTRLRTSAHQLMIEIGRYHRPPIPVEDRLCPTCNVIEDEEHFMLECTQYNREALINWCTNNHKPFQLQNSERFQFILGTRNTKLINLTASFVQKNLKKRTIS